jgi:hypothetical protein
MSILMVQEFRVEEDDLSTPNYDRVSGQLNVRDDPPPGLIVKP